METPLKLARGSHPDPEAVGRTLTDTFLKGRECLPLAANNKPARLSDPYAAKVVKEMTQGRSQEFKRIWAVAAGLLRDGVPLPLVTAALRQMLTMLEVESVALAADRRDTTPRVLQIVTRNETKRQGHLDVWQLRVMETPACPTTLGNALHAGNQYLSSYREWERVCAALLHDVQHVAPVRGLRIAR